MSVDISTELAAILAAIYGEEVRGSIHDALLKMNNNLNTAIGNQLLTIDDTLTATDPHAAADSKKVGDVIQTISGLVAFNYNPASSYAVGDYCSYGYSPTTVGHIYRCTTAINGGEAWNPDHWVSIDFSNRIGEIIQYLFNKIATIYDPTKAYSVGDFCTYGNNKSDPGRIYRCNTAIGSGGETWNASHWTLVNLADEINRAEDELSAFDVTLNASWELGSISTNGVDAVSTTRIRTVNAIDFDAKIVAVSVNSGYRAAIVWYNGSGGFLRNDYWKTGTSLIIPPIGAKKLRIVLSKSQEETADLSYSVNISVIGNRSVDDIERNLLKWNSTDVLVNANKTNRSTGGVNFTWNADGSCSIVGTNTTTVICDFYKGTAIPSWIEPGKDYYVRFSSNDSKVSMRIYNYTVDETLYVITNNTVINIPSTTAGLTIRFTVTAGTHNVTINPSILTLPPISDYIQNIEATANINIDAQVAVMCSQPIYTEVDGTSLYLYFGGLTFRSRISVIKSLTSIGEDVTLVTSPNGKSNCIAIPYGKSLIYRVSTGKVEIVSNAYSGADAILLAYVTSGGKLTAGHLYTNLIEQKCKDDAWNPMPDYFASILPGKLQTITNNMATAGRHGFSMIHITDTHVTQNSHNSEILISNILKNSRVKYLLHNGDIVGSYTDSQQSCMDTLREHISGFELHGKRMFVNIGNHDYNYVHNNDDHPERIITQDQIYAAIMADMQGVVYYQPGKYHWYYVDEASSTALIGFQTGYNYSTFGVLAEDLPPLKALLDSLTVDNIIFSAHQIFSQNSGTGLYTNLNNNNYNQIRTTIDSSVNASKVKCILTGHNHYDYSVVDNGLLVVSTTTDSYIQDSSYAGTTDELAFDVCTFDWSANKLYMTRIGRGSDRVFTLV